MRLFQEMAGDRREFFRAAARYSLLTVLGVAGYFSARPGKLKGQRCIRQGICAGCVQFADCGLPAALSRRSVKSTGENLENKGTKS
jgi:hypothetical protein